jgi:hypothetical protein
LSSTPTWFTALSTTSPSFLASSGWCELLGEQRLVDVVLVLPDADRLRLDLHELGERVLQAPRDRDRATDREIEVRELVARDIARRIHGRARLVDADDEHVGDLLLDEQPPDEALGLATAGAVADRDRRGRVLLHEGEEVLLRLLELLRALGDVDRDRAEKLAGRVGRRALAAGAQARIDADHRARTERRRDQQVAQVVGEDIDRGDVGALLQLDAQVVLDRRREQPLLGVGDRLAQRRRPGRRAVELHHVLDAAGDLRVVDVDVRAQHALGLAAADREEAVRRHRLHRLAERVVLLELGRLLRLRGDALGDQRAFLGEDPAHVRADLGGLGDELGDDVARARERLVGGGDRVLALGAHERRRFRGRIAVRGLREDPLRERLEALLARCRAARAALRLVREVEILERGLGLGGGDALLELRRQLALLADRGEHRGAPLLELREVAAPLLDRADLDLVEAPGPLLAVPRDERDGVALGEQVDHRADRRWSELQLLGEVRHGIEGGGNGSGVGHGGLGDEGRDRSEGAPPVQRPMAIPG